MRSVCSSRISARCVTSRPTIVVSSPSANTRCAASGSAQMLNSAAGVRLPSPIAPPISTIRSGRASACVAKSRPTFVSGPVATSVGFSARTEALGEVLDRVHRLGGARGRGQVGAVEPRLAVDVRCDVARAHERRVCARVHRHVAPPRQLEHAQGVRGRLVERLVARHGRHADELDLRRGEREQDRDRVVVAGIAVEDDRRRCHAPSIASTSADVGSDGCAPSREAATAPAAHARASASSRGRPSSSDTTRQAANASPAAVPSTPVDERRHGAGDLDAVLEERRPLRAVRDGDELPARDDLVLEPVHDQEVRFEVERRAPARRSARRTPPCAPPRRTTSSGTSSWQSTAPAGETAAHRGVRAGDHDDLVLAVLGDDDRGDPGRAAPLELELDAGREQARRAPRRRAGPRRPRPRAAPARRGAPRRRPGSPPCRPGSARRRTRRPSRRGAAGARPARRGRG